MGAVYRARDTVLNRTVAIKVLSATAAGGASDRRLLHEARAASALNHPNIVVIHSIERAGDTDFIVMEHAPGIPLASAPGGLPVDLVLDYGIQIASALAAAHDAGIVHRDVKPGNVIVRPDGHVKVLDFGIAKRTRIQADDATRQLTMDGTLAGEGLIVGTPGYLAPELIAGQPASTRSDVFAVGVLLFEMLTGARPFAGGTTWAVLDATARCEPPAVTVLRPDIPAQLSAVVARCLARNPEDRYPTSGALRDDLQRVRETRQSGPPGRRVSRTWTVIAAGVLVAAAATGFGVWRSREAKRTWARETAAPEVVRLSGIGEIVAAYRLGRQAMAIAPDDPNVRAAWNDVVRPLPVISSPPGADVSFRSYAGTDEGWIGLGQTPTSAPRPIGLMRWRFTKPGFDSIEIAPNRPAVETALAPAGTTPAGMVYVPAGTFEPETSLPSFELPAYFLDKFEVTNRDFKRFVDGGGYRDPKFWSQPFVKDRRTLSFAEAMAAFTDATGRPGPSTWELGTYPDGQDDFPVNGVSWYEAAAYASFAGKQLPTVYHWYRAAGADGTFSEILRFSNFGGKGTVRVGSGGGLGPFGTYDMAGNVKEWCWNEVTGGRRYIPGGAWYDAVYQFRDEDAHPPFDRRPGVGFRCVKVSVPMTSEMLAPVSEVSPDPSRLKPVGEDVYQSFKRLYDYDPTPLDSRIEETDDSKPQWRMEKVSFRAGYGSERVPAYVFVPRGVKPPYQAVIFFPGSDAVRSRSSREMWLHWVEFIVRSGRILVYPVYQQTYERRVEGRQGQNFLREMGIQRGQDVRRTVDYLETRPDVDRSRIALYGLSLGAQLAPVFLATEPRLRTGVLLSGGFETWTIPAEIDPVNFAGRVTQPVIMVNGRDDFDLPLETAQIPLFNALGTAPAAKRHVVLDGGHLPTRAQDVYKEILDWLDRYLGPVGRP